MEGHLIKKSPGSAPEDFRFRRGLIVSFIGRTKEQDFLFDLGPDRFATRLQKLARIVALFEVLGGRIGFAGGAIGDGRRREDELAIGVDVDLADAMGDRFADLIVGDAGSAMENERDVVGGFVDLLKRIDMEALPIGRIDAVDVADASR
jgi:hypothetical protein